MGKLLRNMDYMIPLAALVLIVIGMLLIASATHVEGSSIWTNTFLQKQLIALLVGSIGAVAVVLFDYRLLRDYAVLIYVGNLLLLGLVLLIGEEVQGGQSWIDFGPISFQPSELAKLAVIITLADLLAKRKYNIKYIFGLIVPGLYLTLPFGLILLQNDLGTALVLIAIFLGMIYVAGANPKLLVGGMIVVVAVVAIWIAAYLYLDAPMPLKEYQLERILVLVNPNLDPQGAGYNVRQSKVAIGSGGLRGKGLFAGTQNQLNFLPARHTDFIFSVLGEELGFWGAGLVLISYFILLWRAIMIAEQAKDQFAQLVVAGIIAMFLFHVFENIGMAMGIMPVTGIPLPFISYGGSSLVTNLLAIGLILNVNMRRKKLLF